MDLPTLDPAKEAVERAKSAIPWLPDPKTCPECNTRCRATHEYDHRTAAFDGGQTLAWTCPECGDSWRREEPSMGFSIWR